MNEQGEKVELKYPLTIEGKTVDALYVRRAKVRDVLNTKDTGDEMADSLVLMGKLTGINPPELEDLDMTDFRAVTKVMRGFLGLTPLT